MRCTDETTRSFQAVELATSPGFVVQTITPCLSPLLGEILNNRVLWWSSYSAPKKFLVAVSGTGEKKKWSFWQILRAIFFW